jgi:hypothetical protein
MVAQLGEPEKNPVCGESHEVIVLNMMCDANATPGIVNWPQQEYLISSGGLSLMRCLVVWQD